MDAKKLAGIVERELETSKGLLRLRPSWVARDFLKPGKRLGLPEKDGGWFQVRSARGNGWVHMLSIRRSAARKTSAAAEVAGLAGLASGRAGTGRVVATTGIRGLDEEELKAAQYNESEVTLAESYLTSRADAQKFASKGKLAARKMDYLPDPAAGEKR